MTTRSMLALSALPMLMAAAALTAYAQTQTQTQTPSAQQPMAAQDKAAIESAFTRADANSDGRLSRDEAAKVPALSAGTKFDDLDKNKDGTLNLDEYSGSYTSGTTTK
jgi:Ca2+-binding EF-hand superfamily protein